MLLGGLCWIMKAGALMLVNFQPPYLFEVAPLLIACGLVGLNARLGATAGWQVKLAQSWQLWLSCHKYPH